MQRTFAALYCCLTEQSWTSQVYARLGRQTSGRHITKTRLVLDMPGFNARVIKLDTAESYAHTNHSVKGWPVVLGRMYLEPPR